MTNKEIVDIYINNGLLKKCVDYQFAKCKDKAVQELKADFGQDLVVLLYEYDNLKLWDAHINGHFNALITRILQNNIYSSTSPLYSKYRKLLKLSDEITPKIEDSYGDED